jgi:hypothetical protein
MRGHVAQNFRYFCTMYILRLIETNYWGVFLGLLLLLLSILRLSNFARFYSLVLFWVKANNASEFSKPFVMSRAFSTTGFLFRALIFGLVVNTIYLGNLSPTSFGVELAFWTLGIIGFWCMRTGTEVLLTALWRQDKQLLKIFFIRSLNKEKWAFCFSILLLLFSFIQLHSVLVYGLCSIYFIGLAIIHFTTLKFYFKGHRLSQMHIILYICASEIAPIWLVSQILKH